MTGIDRIARRIYIGGSMASDDDFATWESKAGPFGVQRLFYQWGQDAKESADIEECHDAGRLPWVSFKPPEEGWRGIVSGAYDQDIIARAQRYARLTLPAVVTFHHEPEDEGDPALWASAFCYIGEIFRRYGALDRVAYAPILMAWSWREESGRDVEAWLTPGVVGYSDLLGVDVYGGQKSTLHPSIVFGPVLDTAKELGLPVGIGESGAIDYPLYVRDLWIQHMWIMIQQENVLIWCYWNNDTFTQGGWARETWQGIATSPQAVRLS